MSLTRQNPLNVEVLGRLTHESINKQLEDLTRDVEAAADARTTWLEKQERLYRQRRGIRRKKMFPFPGASNHGWPLTDAIIRRWKPGIGGLILNSDPVTFFHATKPDQIETTETAQQYYHYKFYRIDDIVPKVSRLTDWIAQHGRAYTRQGWDYKTRRRARVVSAEALFPGGPEQAYAQVRDLIEQQRAQAEELVGQGQLDPEQLDQLPPVPTIEEFVFQTLQDEYQIAVENEPMETRQLEQATQQILQGAKNVFFYYHTVERDELQWEVWDPTKVIVPPRHTKPDNGPFIVFEHRLLPDEILRKARDGDFDMKAAQEIVERAKKRDKGTDGLHLHQRGLDGLIQTQDYAEGISPREADSTDSLLVWEMLATLDIDGDGIKEKVVIWMIPPTRASKRTATTITEDVLAIYPYPMPFDEWNVVVFDFEVTSDRPYSSRGIAEMVSVFQATVNRMHNARLDALQIILAPMFTLKSSTPTDSIRRSIRFLPGTVIPLPVEGEFAPVATQATDILKALTEENFTKSLAEQYIGVFDPGVLSQTSAERRTATEVEAVLSQVNSIADSDAKLFQYAMGKVHRQLWKLLMDFGPEEVYFRVTGQDKPRTTTKAEIDEEYDIVPAGTPENTQRQLQAARSREALELLFPDQTGLINKRELYRWYLGTIDPTRAKLVIRSEQDAAAIQAIVQAANLQEEENGGTAAFGSF